MKLTKPITTGTLDEREQALKKQGARLMTFADIKEIYATNDKKNIELLKQDMKDSWILIRAEKEYDEATLKKMANGKEINKWDLSSSNRAVGFGGDDWFHVGGNYSFGDYDGLSRGVHVGKEIKLKKCPHCKGVRTYKRGIERMKLRINKYGIEQSFDIVFEGELEGQNGFGLKFNSYLSGSMITLDFYKGSSLCLYKNDIKELIEYLTKKYKEFE